jgi:CheY-like chemotaxis protein
VRREWSETCPEADLSGGSARFTSVPDGGQPKLRGLGFLRTWEQTDRRDNGAASEIEHNHRVLHGGGRKNCTGRNFCNTGAHRRKVLRKVRAEMTRILLAEDNPADVYLIRAALEEHGIDCPVQVAADGQEVLRIIGEEGALAETQLGLIILDLNLPRHDGIEILERLRQTERLAHVPVVVLTSSDSPRDRIVASSLGAACFLRKPSNLEQFLNLGLMFKELLGNTKAQSTGV